MKSPFEAVWEIFLENLDRQKENRKFNFSNLDRFMIWIVGFSISGIAIIVSNLTSLNRIFNHGVIKTILILLSLSIVAGIIYRFAFYLYQMQYQIIEAYLQVIFSGKEVMEIEPKNLTNETDINKIIKHIKDAYGEDVSYVLRVYDSGDEKSKNLLVDSLKDHYKKAGEWAKNDFESAINSVKDIYKNTFGLSQKKTDKMFAGSNTSYKLKIYDWIITIALSVSCLCFIGVIIILVVLY